ncbi:DUF1344 domain-containing protein [Rhizobium sp. KVB221]|uniref:DUF1344 domain-containing protein n=1 Tax=Rhizobium setariae TaxID=2801340 RepID=A0A936YMC8_9HYPH|nr:DUF1344 domain-containing protein [Rhizobium setariae]MBL0370856.1 DUF1344 domain-containing protein [Rhizobium setariae]
MRALYASVVVLSSFAIIPAAYAASMTMTGTVKAYAPHKSLELANGDTFVLPANFKDPGIKVGEKVKVAYQKVGKKLDAETVSIVH